MADEQGRVHRDRSDAPPPDSHAAWVEEGIRLRELQDVVLRAVEQAERTIRTAAAMKARALAHLGVLADQEAAHAERVPDIALASSRAVEAAHRSGIAEVATTLRMPEGSVRRAWEDARTTAEEHPRLWKALLDGQVSERHVTVALEELTTLPPEARTTLESEILEKAPTVTAAGLQSFARRRRELHHPESVDVRHRRARAGRHVLLTPPRDGMSTLTAHLPAVAAHAIYNRCTDAAMAARSPEDPRTLSQLRADALMAYALADSALLIPHHDAGHGTSAARVRESAQDQAAADESGDGPTPAGQAATGQAPGAQTRAGQTPAGQTPAGKTPAGLTGSQQRMLEAAHAEALGDDDAHAASAACDIDIYGIVPTVAVLVPVDWLAEDPLLHGDTDGPGPDVEHRGAAHGEHRDAAHGELVGAGPIDRDTARALAAQSPSLRRILTDPHTGVPLDMSRSTYRVPSHLRVFAQLRDETCRFPLCRRRAEACDLDHVEAWEEGGSTSASNLAHLCRMHHRLKHAGSWSVQVADEPGAGRLRPSTLTWTSPTGRASTTRAAIGGANDITRGTPPTDPPTPSQAMATTGMIADPRANTSEVPPHASAEDENQVGNENQGRAPSGPSSDTGRAPDDPVPL
ncbi:HNH endonuclease signature motif containing protein [Sanguibacter massiliensis]|uniref:HNH endonuclease signature motif containing protein n=1 Tax=Sanguibacter massiliensis TaxID=1973217 RepID=UPI0013EDFA5E|nr:HNH endonuclease signature motif containing protein [Sanguibacter massiliensis]